MGENNTNKPMKTSLYKSHLDLNAKVLEFANFLMPIHYDKGIKFEYNAVRTNVGVFDVSHMGIIKVSGLGTSKYLNHILSNDILKLEDGQAIYSLMCNKEGGIIDDLIVYHINGYFLLIVNASNKHKVLNWMHTHQSDLVNIQDLSSETSLIAVQGPNSKERLESLLNLKLSDMEFYSCKSVRYDDNDIFIARTGYTGELGYEILGNQNIINSIWNLIISNDCAPAGLAVRDVLRIEMGYCLYGHEIAENINPVDAGLNWILKKNNSFIGKNEIFNSLNQYNKIIFIKMLDRGVLRKGCKILCQDSEIGYVTSGTFSYLLNCGVGIGFIKNDVNIEGNFSVLIRDKKSKVDISKKPFIKNRSLKNN